jgi:hypothetical protein
LGGGHGSRHSVTSSKNGKGSPLPKAQGATGYLKNHVRLVKTIPKIINPKKKNNFLYLIKSKCFYI